MWILYNIYNLSLGSAEGLKTQIKEQKSTVVDVEVIGAKHPLMIRDLTNLAEGGRIGFAGGGIGPVLDVQEDDLNITDFMQDQGIPFGQMASNIQNDAILEKLYEEY